jgi:hypothetical protein
VILFLKGTLLKHLLPMRVVSQTVHPEERAGGPVPACASVICPYAAQEYRAGNDNVTKMNRRRGEEVACKASRCVRR